MKIAFVSHPGYAVLPPAGSVEICTHEVARRLAERHAVTVYGSSAPGREDATDAGIRYRFIRHGADAKLGRVFRPLHRLRPADKGFFASPLNSLLYWLRVASDIRREGYDVVHVANLTQALPVIRRLNPDIRLVLHMHCEWLIQLDRRLVARRLRHADAILGVSRHITEPIRERFPDLADRCHTVSNGVEIGPEPAPREADGTVTLLHVGRISPEKGHHVLFDALNQVLPDHPQVRLVLVGEESVIPIEWAVGISSDPVIRDLERFYGSSYLEQIKDRMSKALAERTQFVGRIDHSETARHYAAADLFVFPSYFESMGIPPVEAMAAGLPVISSPVGGANESVVEGETGLFVERGDVDGLAAAIVALVDDPARRAALGAAGRARAAKHFSWDGVTAEFEHVLETAARAPRAPSRHVATPVSET
ncbi:glycosyltransferase family 4 protein [Solirubrobacter sp. CPCC 204708]|uniref:Glycosyltransferase family 4 protein n=1 Tax=Solirubrobacter deserti TaxID=2282478 RepID=A0ABT4RJC3_9ACTN|nr:glycosyltransferase family 4 protein [Solirubrobacter deserti]MBE2320229.1 glycosyltransferase family 4 protein [Solirubrobacter deserti]MDA0138385.1 glycosyltransferase family 4 protein [Solirubrobacter deserti]